MTLHKYKKGPGRTCRQGSFVIIQFTNIERNGLIDYGFFHSEILVNNIGLSETKRIYKNYRTIEFTLVDPLMVIMENLAERMSPRYYTDVLLSCRTLT